MKKTLKRLLALVLAGVFALALAACGGSGDQPAESGSASPAPSESAAPAPSESAEPSESAPAAEYRVGICKYVDDASLNQIVDNIKAQLDTLGQQLGVTFTVDDDNCNADATLMNQIISNFIADEVDLMVGVATPVAMAMQAATADNGIPVVFSAVSDPVGSGIVESMEAPGANITGTSDYLDTNAMMNLIFAADPDADLIGLLYNLGQDSSTAAIAAAKEYLDEKQVAYKEYTGTNTDEIRMAVQAMVADGVDAAFTPSDNTIMTAELAIYEAMIDGGIAHYGGADSFALNGAFVGYGVDYANLGVETANMVADILVNGADPATTPVMTFDNGTATVNTDTCTGLGFDYDTIEAAFAPLCTKVQTIVTADSF